MSSVFPNWKQFAVHQRRPCTGCIPTGYEMLLRAVGAEGIDFPSFQDDFDLDQNLKPGEQPRNNFESVAAEVRKKYPCVNFRRVGFESGRGADKLAFVEQRLANQQPVLVSLALKPFGKKGWHIMPVVDATDDELILLRGVPSSGTPETCNLRRDEFVRIHNQYDGGDDVGHLAAWQ